MFCRELAVEFVNRYSEIEKTKTKLILIGSGSATMAKGFHQDYIKNDNVVCLVDSKLNFYNALKLKKSSIISVFSMNTLSAGKRAVEKGFSQGLLEGDTFQLGGVFLFDNEKIVYSFLETYAGELPNFNEVMKVLQQ